MGNLEAARRYFEQAVEIHRQAGYRLGEAADLGSLALVYEDMGDWEKASRLSQTALQLDESIGYLEGQATDLGNLGGLYFQVRELAKAYQYHEKALVLHRTLGNIRGEAKDLGNLALIAFRRGDLEEAIRNIVVALALQQRLASPEGEAEQLLNLAICYQTAGDLQTALSMQNSAIEMIRALGNQDMLMRTLVGRGDTCVARDDMAGAYEDYREALTIFEQMRGGLLEEEHRISFLRGGKVSLYWRMIKLLSHNLMLFREALEYVEKSRSRGLVDLLAISTMMLPSKVEATIVMDEQILLIKIQTLQSTLRISKNEAQRRTILRELSVVRELHDLKLMALDEEFPEYVSLRKSQPLDWTDMVKLLMLA